MMRLILAALAFTIAPAAAGQQHDHNAPACAAMDAALPAGVEDWNGKLAAATATRPEDGVLLELGKGYEAGLLRRDSVAFAAEPEKPGGSVSYSGVFAFEAPEAGNYVVALSTAAWIDVVEDGEALEPVSFGRGPECTTIRKMVVYPLKPGRHVLQIAGNGAETAQLLVAKQP